MSLPSLCLPFLLSLSCLPHSLSAENPPHEISGSRHGVKVSTDWLTVGMSGVTFTCILLKKDWTGLKQNALSLATTLGTTYLLKYTIRKARPDGTDHHAFPSNHAAFAFANAAFLQRRYGWGIGVPAYLVSTYVAWGRTYAKRHDWWDVLAGATIGIGAAYIYTRPLARNGQLSIAPWSDGENFMVSTSIQF